ncbi:hypothetical protein L1049_024310 [Liquidambar formosana]|uniref:Uncharacterized protein n=1 Tax=Liquidambar formosana TaxID=63359 RepID=A0AAP0S1R3_LIQFO
MSLEPPLLVNTLLHVGFVAKINILLHLTMFVLPAEEIYKDLVANLDASDIDSRWEESLIDGILYAFQE